MTLANSVLDFVAQYTAGVEVDQIADALGEPNKDVATQVRLLVASGYLQRKDNRVIAVKIVRQPGSGSWLSDVTVSAVREDENGQRMFTFGQV